MTSYDPNLVRLIRTIVNGSIAESQRKNKIPGTLSGVVEDLDSDLDVVYVRMDQEATQSDPTVSDNYGNPGVVPVTRLGETFIDEQVRVTFDAISATASAMRTGVENKIVLPFGTEEGQRIILDGNEGAIGFFDLDDALRGLLTPDLWYIGNIEGARAQLDPNGGLRFTDSDGTLIALIDPTQGFQLRNPDTGIVQAQVTSDGLQYTNSDATESVELGEISGLIKPKYESTWVASGAGGSVTSPGITPGSNDLELRHVALSDANNNHTGATYGNPLGLTQHFNTVVYTAVGNSSTLVGLFSRPSPNGNDTTFVNTAPVGRAIGTTLLLPGVVGGPTPTITSMTSGSYSYSSVTADLTLTRGATAVDETLVAIVTFHNDGGGPPASWTTPKGWVFLGGIHASAINTLAVGAWAKLSGASEPTSETVRITKAGGAVPTTLHWTVLSVAGLATNTPHTDIRVNGTSVGRGLAPSDRFASTANSAAYGAGASTDMQFQTIVDGSRAYRIEAKSLLQLAGGAASSNANAEFGIYINGTYYDMLWYQDNYAAVGQQYMLSGFVDWRPTAGTYTVELRMSATSVFGMTAQFQSAVATRKRYVQLVDIGSQ